MCFKETSVDRSPVHIKSKLQPLREPPPSVHCYVSCQLQECLLPLRREGFAFLPHWWLFERLLYVYLNHTALNNLPISRVREDV